MLRVCIDKKTWRFALIVILYLMQVSQSSAFAPVNPGGSNYAWYKLGSDVGLNCREPYGIIKNYHIKGVRSVVKSQLKLMRGNGQIRLRIPIYHMRNPGGGTILNSAGGNLSSQHRTNLKDFLADIKTAGFVEVEVGFFPQSLNNPATWDASNLGWQESRFQENWNLIVSLRPIIIGSSLHYRIDLMNEGAPANNQKQVKKYVFKLWWNYNFIFGKTDTVGFSIIAEVGTSRYDNMVSEMNRTGFGLPYLWSVHVYDNITNALQNLSAHQSSAGDNRSWVIGETYYNDSATDSALSAASLRRTVWHVYQWPLTKNKGCDGHVDVTPLNYRYD